MTIDSLKINDNWIYQSNKLIQSSHLFTVLELKLIRLLASMIKKDDEDFQEYKFNAVDISKILNINAKNIYRDLDKVTDKLMARFIKIKNDDAQDFEKYHLIKKVNFRNGILTMKIDEEMKDFYLELNQYTKYQLKNIMQFKSAYSFRLYELMKQYEKIKYREILIDELRIILDMDKKEYPLYANLKQKIINIAVSEINSNTDLHIDFDEIKTGRKVTSIKFHISSNKNTYRNEIATTLLEDPKDMNLTKQVQEIFHKHNITEHEARCILKDAKNKVDLIKQCYSYSLTKDVPNIVGYMRTLVKGFNEPQKNIKVGGFNDYEQRKYDFDELEKKLLGWGNNQEDTEEEYEQESISI